MHNLAKSYDCSLSSKFVRNLKYSFISWTTAYQQRSGRFGRWKRQSLRECKHTSYSDKKEKKKKVKSWFLKDKVNFYSNIVFIKSVPDKEINAPKKSSLRMESRHGKHTCKLFLAHMQIHCSTQKALSTSDPSTDCPQAHFLHSPP